VVNNAAAACGERVERDAVTSFLVLPEDEKRPKLPGFIPRLLSTIAIAFLLMAAAAQAGTRSQEKQPLGSLSSVGQVYVNNALAPADTTIFTGDVIRTGPSASATFTSSAEGTYQILPGSQLAFNGGDQYVAELQAGSAVLSSRRGPQGLNLRIGSYTAVGVTEGEQSTSKIEKAADGSFTVTCLDGSVILVPTAEGSSGLLIQAGQMVNISARGKLSPVKDAAPGAVPASTPAPGETPPPAPPPTTTQSNNNYTKWIIIALAGAGGAGAAIALGSHKSNSVSPATP
jgi:hypothetical protein